MSIFTGDAMECLKDCSERYGFQATSKLVARFCEVMERTVPSWIQGESAPKGEKLIKLMCILHQIGYSVEELESLPHEAFKLAQLIGYGVLTHEAATEALDYADQKGVYDIILRGGGLIPDRYYKLVKLVGEHEGQINQAVDKWQKVIDAKLTIRGIATPQVEQVSTPASSPKPSLGEQPRAEAIDLEIPALVILLANSLKATQILLDQLGRTTTIEEDMGKKMVVELVGADRLEQLVDALDALI